MKLNTASKVAIRAIDKRADDAGLPAYSEVMALLADLAKVSAEREIQRTVQNCDEWVDVQIRTSALLSKMLKFGVRP